MSYYFLYKKKGIPTWLAYGFLLLLTIGLTFTFKGRSNRIVSRADKNLIAKNVTVSNLTNSSATVFFTTADNFKSHLVLTQTDGSEQVLFDSRDTSSQIGRTVHYYILSGLSSNTSYRFRINLEGKTDPKDYSFETLSLTYPLVSNAPVFGKILLSNLEPATDLVLRAKVGNSQFSTLTKTTGEWLVTFPFVLDQNHNEVKLENETVIFLDLFSGKKKSTIKVKYLDAQPLRSIIFGKNYDFTLPDSVLGVSRDQNPSKIISFPKSQGVVNSFTPTFRGKGTPNTLIKLALNPSAIDLLISVDQSGEWRFTPQTPLLPGKYILQVTDQKLTEKVSFTVGKSGEAVLGEATPSATTTSIPTINPTQGPTPTKEPNSTPSPTVRPTTIPTIKPTLITPTIVTDEIPALGLNNNLMILFASGLSLLGLFLVMY